MEAEDRVSERPVATVEAEDRVSERLVSTAVAKAELENHFRTAGCNGRLQSAFDANNSN